CEHPFWGPDHSGPDPERTTSVGYATLSRNSSTAAPIFSSLLVSLTVRLGLPTYQAWAVIWCFAMKSFTAGVRTPGQPSQLLNTTSRSSGIFVAKSSIYGSQSSSYVVANKSFVSFSRNT